MTSRSFSANQVKDFRGKMRESKSSPLSVNEEEVIPVEGKGRGDNFREEVAFRVRS